MSACESAEQQSAEGAVGLGGVTEGLHDIRPATGILHMVLWAFAILLAMASTASNRATQKSFWTFSISWNTNQAERQLIFLFIFFCCFLGGFGSIIYRKRRRIGIGNKGSP
jgi:hypothetical protein